MLAASSRHGTAVVTTSCPGDGAGGDDVPPDEPAGPDDPHEGSVGEVAHVRSRPSGPSRGSRTGR